MKILGMMSGTSYDGIDSALCDFELVNKVINIKLISTDSKQYSNELRNLIIESMPPLETSMKDVCVLDTLIGQAFAEAANSMVVSTGILPDLIVSHGQTMFHWVDDSNKARGTLQLGEASWIAEATGVQVLSNIRSRDVAAGGQGAPLVSVLDNLMFSGTGLRQGALNLGGISNITIISNLNKPIAYDIGVANGLMDAAILAYSKGEIAFDRDGQIAKSGNVNQKQLTELLSHSFYKLEPPKSTGKEVFHLPYLIEIFGNVNQWVIKDVLATLLELTVETVALEVEKYRLSKLYVAGGGTQNTQMMLRLKERLQECDVVTISEAGIPTQAKEAIAFALIGFLTLHSLPGQIPSCTGASGSRILGSLTPGKKSFYIPDPILEMPNGIKFIE